MRCPYTPQIPQHAPKFKMNPNTTHTVTYSPTVGWANNDLRLF